MIEWLRGMLDAFDTSGTCPHCGTYCMNNSHYCLPPDGDATPTPRFTVIDEELLSELSLAFTALRWSPRLGGEARDRLESAVVSVLRAGGIPPQADDA